MNFHFYRLSNLFFLFSFLGISGLSAQDSSKLILLKKLEMNCRFVEVDRLQQFYTVCDDHSVQKYSSSGDLLKSFNENSLGAISSLDVSNPFQPLVFYSEYQTALMLDRSMSELYRFRLSDLNFMQLDAVAVSTDNRLWVFDPNNFKLLKIDSDGTLNLESPDLSSILENAFFPISLREAEFKVFANDPENGMLVFDNFGNFIQKLSISGIAYFQVSGYHLIWMDSEKRLHRLHLKTFREEISPISDFGINTEGLEQFCIMPDRFLLRYTDRLELYRSSFR